MTRFDVIELAAFGLALLAIIPFLGSYMALVFEGSPPAFMRPFKWLEYGIYRISGIDQTQEMDWKTYAKSLITFNLIGLSFLFLLQVLQNWLPLNPEHYPGVSLSLAFNTAASYVTNTNWQVYEGEHSLSYLTQTLGLTVQNFLSAATGITVLIAFIRGIRSHSTPFIGNFWSDLIRTVVYILLPLSFFLALILVNQGTIQNFHPYQEVITWENGTQTIPQGPVATQIAIKQLGTNGGGFFNANSAHPFENPTPLSNFLAVLGIISIPAAALYKYGILIGIKKQGFILLWVMLGLCIAALSVALTFEWLPNPVLEYNPVMEGKETRIGVTNSVLWSTITTATSNGSVNNMHDSLSPLSGGIVLFQIMLGEIIFGGVGTGLCSMLMYVLLTVFIAGLMVGRTPEYIGKKIEKREIQLAMIAILTPCALMLIGTCLALSLPSALNMLENKGPHGLSEMLYAFASTSGGNGSAFEGLKANNLFYNLCFGIIMLVARTAVLIPSLAIAGSLAQKKIIASSLGTFKTDTTLFGILLTCVILIVAALTFFPALALGPVVEQFLMLKGQSF